MVFFKKLFLVLFLFLIPFVTKASVVINEIMYDLEGSDTGREWVEIRNNGSENINLTNWKFFENNINHKLTLFQGSAILMSNSFAIIADNPAKFLEDWPNFSGTIFDSSFSLSNTGELLALINENGEKVNEIVYSSEWGANGNGKSLQKINNTWKENLPTPGYENGISSDTSQGSLNDSESSENNSSNNQESTASENYQSSEENYQSELGEFSEPDKSEEAKKTLLKQKIKKTSSSTNSIEIVLKEKIALVNTPFSFTPSIKILGQEKKEGYFYWNFGDGYTLSLENNNSVSHLYEYPGNYLVSLKYCSSKNNSDCLSGSVSLKVFTPQILIKNVGDIKKFFVEVFNESNYDLNISNFIIVGKDKAFIIPEGTIILSKSSLIFSPKLTGLDISDKYFLKILYPNLETLYDYSIKNDSNQNFAIQTTSFKKNKLSLENQNQAENSFQKNNKNNSEKDLSEESLVNSFYEKNKNNLSANAFEVLENEDKNNFLKYLLMLMGIVLVVITSIFFLREERSISQERKIAEEVEIIEDKEFSL